jgi:hypothetical protein
VLGVAEGFADGARMAARLADAISDVAAWANDNGLAKLLSTLGRIAGNAVNPVGAVTSLVGQAAGLSGGKAAPTISRADMLALAQGPTSAGRERLRNLLDEQKAEQGAASAARERAAALKAAAAETARARKSDQDYLDGLIDERVELGKTPAELRILAADKRAAAASTNDFADSIRETSRALEDERLRLEVLTEHVRPTADAIADLTDKMGALRAMFGRGEITGDEFLSGRLSILGTGKLKVPVVPELDDHDLGTFVDRLSDAIDGGRAHWAESFGDAFADGLMAAMDGDLGRVPEEQLPFDPRRRASGRRDRCRPHSDRIGRRLRRPAERGDGRRGPWRQRRHRLGRRHGRGHDGDARR